MTIASKIRDRRLALGLTQEQLSFVTGLRPNHISMIETGRKAPTVATLKRIAKALDCKLDDLVE